MVHLCEKYLPRSAAVTTVCDSIAQLYTERFGIVTQVMRNSGPWQDLVPTNVGAGSVRLVHSGAADHGRSLETMIDVTMRLDDRYTLDLYLVPVGDGGRFLEALKQRASGCERIRFHPPVAPSALPETLNSYDVGISWLPPTHANAQYALPNKFFDFVQARLAISVGPSVEMASLVNRYGLGVVSDGYSIESCVKSLSSLSATQISQAKSASDAASRELSFSADESVARSIVASALGQTP
jgi:hypothetical protein